VWSGPSYPVYKVKVITQPTLDGVELGQGQLVQLSIATEERSPRGATKHVKVPLELFPPALRLLPLLLRQPTLRLRRLRSLLRVARLFLARFAGLEQSGALGLKTKENPHGIYDEKGESFRYSEEDILPFKSLGSPRQFGVFHENSKFYLANE